MSRLDFACRHHYASGFALDVAFTMRTDVAALFGPSGSGKTTILAIITGFLRPDSAQVSVGDQRLIDTAAGLVLPPEKRRIGFVAQDQLLFPHLSAADNLNFGRRRAPTGGRDFVDVVKVLELEPLLARRPAQLSGGERQRVALGRAILSGPDLLVLDEPLTALDESLKQRILAYLERALERWRVPTLFVTHAQAEVRRLAQEVIVLENGRLVTQGSPEVALSDPTPLAWGDSIGPVNLLRLTRARQENGRWLGQIGEQSLQLPMAPHDPAGAMYVQFFPRDVILGRDDVAGLSVRNRWHGAIRQMVTLGDAVFVAVDVDVGQIIWAEITAQAAAELGLSPGQSVTCLVKTQSLRIVQ